MRKRILSLLLCIVLCLSFAPTAVCAEDLPEMAGVTISQNGIMSWDTVAGAAKYHVGIGGQGWDVTETSVDLISLFNRTGYDTGSYSVNVTAYNASGERITKQWMLNNYSFTATNPKLATPTNLRWDGATAKWDPVPKRNDYFVILYKNGSRVRGEYYYSEEAQLPLEAGNDYTFSVRASAPGYTDSDWANSEVNHFTGNTAIKNVRISEDGFITWDPFPGASSYGVSIVEAATGHRVETTFDDLNRLCSGLAAGNYTINLRAYDSSLQVMTEVWTGSFSYIPGREFSVTVTNGGAYTDSALNNRVTVATMGDTVYLVPDVPEGKSFDGWEVISPANLVISTFRDPSSFVMPACNVAVTAKFKSTGAVSLEYLVSFQLNGHGDLTTKPADQTVISGQTATKPADPTAEGWTFDGWYLDESCTTEFDFNTPIIAAISEIDANGVLRLWAKWTENVPTEYLVSFQLNGHGDATTRPADQTVISGQTATKPADPTAEGWTFDGWYLDESCTTEFDFNTPIIAALSEIDANGVLRLWAKWTQNTTPPTTTYTIIAGANGEWTKGSTTGLAFTSDAPFDKFDSVKVDESTIAATNYTAEAGSTKITLAPAYLETLSVGTHTIEIVSNDGSASTNFTVKSAEQPPVVPTNYTVTFNMNGHGDQITAQTVKEGEKATKPTDPTASGWTFNGWYADATFSAVFDFDTAIAADTTIYAKWTANSVTPPTPANYTVTFNMNGHGTQVPAQTVEEGNKATKPTDPTESGYTFDGWYADATFSAKFDFSSAINADTTVYAKWTKNTTPPTTTYTVSFNMNGHGDQVAAQTVNEGAKATKPADPKASGYTFGGWYADATCSTKFDFNSAITANTTVYAKWTKNSVAPADPTTPKTGDNSNMFLWIALLLVSGGALVGTAVYGKKKKYRAE